MYQINFYVPSEQVLLVKEAMFNAGAGKIGNYDCCSFETKGLGQFRPLNGANPYLGNMGEIEIVNEVKVEMVCNKEVIKEVVAALKKTHPYETPAYHILEVLNF